MSDAGSAGRPQFGLEELPIAMAALDGELCVVSTNRCFDEVIRLSAEEVLGRDVIELLTTAAIGVETLAGRQIYQLSDDFDGGWVRLDLQRRQGGVLAVITDISAERRAVDELRFADQTRERLMQDTEVRVWRYDPEQETYFLDLGRTDHETPNSFDLDALRRSLHPDDAPAESEARERITRQGGAAELELRRRNHSGGWRHVNLNLRAGRRTASGLYEIYGLTHDVTALAVTRDAANAAAQRLRLALKAAHAGVFEYDYATQRFWLSPDFAALLLGDPGAASLPDQFLVFHEDDRDSLVDLDTRMRTGLKAGAVDVRLMGHDGPRWVRICLEAQLDAQGRPQRSVGLAIDIDDQKRQELALAEARTAAEAATEAKSNFLASMSHEIRTPMNGIVAVLNLLRHEALSDDGLHLLSEALACSEMLGQLINDVLDFSKIEAGRLDMSPQPCDPLEIARSVASLVAPQAHAKGLELEVSAEYAMGYAHVDPVRLRQCLFNVIGNAVKFTEHGRVAVRLAYVAEGDLRRLRCEVEDTGVGVPEAARATLFDRFQQADGGTTRRFGGTGLGLAISRSLTRMMGGDMDFTSQEGRGSTFWFEVAAPPAEAPAPTTEISAGDAPLEGLNILVVDDNATNRLVAVKSLEALGAQASAVESGEAAVAAAPGGGFDLILMDINMPHMDGLEATRRIRALDSPVAQVPVVALTADVMRREQAAYRGAGMDGVVCKPFSPAQLLAEIQRLAGSSEATALSA